MRAAIFFPARYVSHEHARAYDVLEPCAESIQCFLDISEALLRLFVSVTESNYLPVIAGGRRAGDINSIPGFHGSRVTHDRFPLSAGRDAFAFGHSLSRSLVRIVVNSGISSGALLAATSQTIS